MAVQVIMPALGMAQETGTLVRWLKVEGEAVREGEAIAEIQTDKATVELEARASGVLGAILAREGQDVPVGQVIATIRVAGEVESAAPLRDAALALAPEAPETRASAPTVPAASTTPSQNGAADAAATNASPLARRLAAEHGIDVRELALAGRRVQKADVEAYLQARQSLPPSPGVTGSQARLAPASPKARRIAKERGIEISTLQGSGPALAVLTRDVLAAQVTAAVPGGITPSASVPGDEVTPLSGVWRIMAERTTQSWQEIPHFFLLREVNASRLITWREQVRRQQIGSVTYTDLLVKLVAATLRTHPRINASWGGNGIRQHAQANIGIAVATDDGLVVPVIHAAEQLSLAEIAAQRELLVKRAQVGRLRPENLASATFTISNLGMYGVDAFNAIVPDQQAGILAVGRIVERVVPVHGAPAVQPVMALSLSCDHRVVDGARGAQFLSALADLIEEPLALFA